MDRTQKSINYAKKKKINPTRSKSSTDDEIPKSELINNSSIPNNIDLPMIEEDENFGNNLSKITKVMKPDAVTKKRKKGKMGLNESNHQLEIYMYEKENKNINLLSGVNGNPNSREKDKNPNTSTNAQNNFQNYNSNTRKISEITDISLSDSNLSNESNRANINSIAYPMSPNFNSIQCPISTRESITEIKTNKMNFSEFKMEEINFENQNNLSRLSSESGLKIVKSLSFGEEIKKNLCYYLKNYSQTDIEVIFNDDRHIYEEEENLNATRNPNYFLHHKNLNPGMRTILLDWLMEVCGQLSFKRSTFHSAIVLIDIFLSKVENLPTNLLQLTGITCLIIAAKNEVKKFKFNIVTN